MTRVLKEVMGIKKKLDDIIHSEGPNQGPPALGLLRALEECDITLGILQKSGVCISLTKLRKNVKDKEVSSMIKKLIKSWKKLLSDDGEGCSYKKYGARNARLDTLGDCPKGPLKKKCVIRPCTIPAMPPPSKPAPTSSRVVSHPPKQPTPTSPVNKQLLSPHSSVAPSMSSEGCSAHGERKDPADAAGVSEVVSSFPPNLDVLDCAPSTGSDVRDCCREVIVKALKKEVGQVSIKEECKFYNLGSEIEQSVFECFGDEGRKYKQRVRSRVSNLGDLKNPSLRQNVIAGHVSPAKIAIMTPEEMASDSMKQLREKLTKEAIQDAMVAQTDGSKGSDLLRCPECSKNNCSYTQAQTLCSDEPMTTFAYCNDCGQRWIFY